MADVSSDFDRKIPVVKDLFLIPYWFKDIALRNGGQLSDLADATKLRSKCSLDDFSQCLQLNKPQFASKVLGNSGMAIGNWSTWFNKEQTQIKFLDDASMLADACAPALASRLFSPESYNPKYPKPFEILDLMESVLFIVIYPGHFAADKFKASQVALARELCAYFNSLYGYSVTARQGFYSTYYDNINI